MDAQAKRDLVVVGASAGGVEALRDLAAALPADFPACVMVVLHVPRSGGSVLPSILDRAGPLPARHAVEGDEAAPGTILVAPPDRHLVVYDGKVTLSRGPQENGHRPAVDVLFRTAARARRGRVVGVLLSGALDDGAAGMVAISQVGGACVVQSFEEALYDSMPRSAAAAVPDCATATVADMPALLVKLLEEPVPVGQDASALMQMEAELADMTPESLHDQERPGEPSGFGCPDCHGALFQIVEGPLTRFRCRVGHAWSPESLAARQTNDVESALWMGLRSLEEKAALSDKLEEQAVMRGHDLTAQRFAEEAGEARRAAELIRELIVNLEVTSSAPTEQGA